MRLAACLIMVLLLAGCSKQEMLDKFASPEEQTTARNYLDQIHAHDFTAVEKDIDPSLKSDGFGELLQKMADLPPPGVPTSVKLVGARVFQGSGVRTVNTTFEYSFGDKLFVENLAIQDKGGVKTITGLHVIPEEKSLEEQNKFTLSGKSRLQYAVLTAAVLVPLLMVYALVVCIRTRIPRRKWLWILFIIVGFGTLSVNWATGEWGFRPLSFQLFGAGATAQIYGPWIVQVALPIGAIAFLFRWKWRRLKVDTPPVVPAGEA